MNIGAHIARKKTLVETMNELKENGANVLQIFTTNPRSSKIYDNEKYFKESHLIKKYCSINNFHIFVHSPYVFNIAKPFMNGKKLIDIIDLSIFNDIRTANMIGARGYIIHVGKSLKEDIQTSLNIMRNNIKEIINEMIKNKIKTKLVLETSTGQGTELLSNFNDLMDFYYYSFTDEEREVFKICIDTCHVWNAGYELREIIELTRNKEDIICIHLNNSKNKKGAKVDRHDIIFNGFINPIHLKDFAKEFEEISYIILETPSEDYKNDIKFLISN